MAIESVKPGSSGGIGDPSLMEAAAVAAALQVDVEQGLSTREAARRLARNGPNALRAAPDVPAWRRALSQFQDPLVYLLLAAVVVALVAWWVEGRTGWPVDAIVIAAVVLLNGLSGHVQEAKARDAVAALARMTAITTTVLRDGKPQRVPSAGLVVGDVIELAEGDAVGADARLLEAATLRVQEAALTGESEALLKATATLRQPTAVANQLNMVFKGTAVAQGSGRAVVTATGMQTQVEMTIERVMTASGGTHISGVGYAPVGQVAYDSATLADEPLQDETRVVLSGGSLAGNADLRQASGGKWEIQGDPPKRRSWWPSASSARARSPSGVSAASSVSAKFRSRQSAS